MTSNMTHNSTVWSDGGVLSVLGFNVLTSASLFVLFCILWHSFPDIYTPRTDPTHPAAKPAIGRVKEESFSKSWSQIYAAWNASEDEILLRSGHSTSKLKQ